MRDPEEGVGHGGVIVTGVRRERVPAAFEPVVRAAVEAVRGVELYLYGSVATGQARVGESDVDLLSVGLPATEARDIGGVLSDRFAGVCRGVEIAAIQPHECDGDSDEAYGYRVFLRHYCLQIAGPPRDGYEAFPADIRAARAFNGDIGMHVQEWGRVLDDGADPAELGRRLARKTLLAVASLVSVHDQTWTTDRVLAARRWARIEPGTAADMAELLEWSDQARVTDRARVRHMLDGTVAEIVRAFATTVGLWA